MVALRRAQVVWSSYDGADQLTEFFTAPGEPAPRDAQAALPFVQEQTSRISPPTAPVAQQTQHGALGASALSPTPGVGGSGGTQPRLIEPPRGSVRPGAEPDPVHEVEVAHVLTVRHETRYLYNTPVERSVSRLRLCPTTDTEQHLLEHELTVSTGGKLHTFEDVFGNITSTVEVTKPYTELLVVSYSKVQIVPRMNLFPPDTRTTLPLVWMPWQREMMSPFLLPPELPESQLEELTAFAMSFAKRQDYELVPTLLDFNSTIRRDFAYVSASTHLGTTPFEVYVNRRGVCQDFANLFICLARLLGVPARYRVGYIHTGADYDNQIQSEASHAWVEVYLPMIGWRGFDPTNGCLAGADHVRVATGRNFIDATPTSGTIYKGGGMETLSVNVTVTRD
jgi:transglutaminase-like putative cysteine protease